MDILISFTTSVGVTESFRVAKNVANDIVNQSIVLSVKNVKIPHPGGNPDRSLNAREYNRTNPPDNYYSGYARLLRASKYRVSYQYDTWSPGVPWRIIEIDESVIVSTTPTGGQVGIRKVKSTYYYPDGSINLERELEEDINEIIKVCDNFPINIWGACSLYREDPVGGSYYKSFYTAHVAYAVVPL